MKMTEQMKHAQANMDPGIITQTGFLGDDTRNIVDIIEADEEKMRLLGLDFDIVAEKLTYLLTEGRNGLGEPTTVDEVFIVKVDEARGYLACPFEDGIYRKLTATITNKKSGNNLICTDLSIHLLEEHHFLEGKGSTFRLEPDRIKLVLEL
ncbi:MAG: hypothetical protein ACLFR1_00255 [Spirochaetia bacterium]